MFDRQKQIDYWVSNAENDLETARLLINNSKILHGLFFCHLTIEKAIKAHVTKETNEVPPKSHNLILLLEKTNLHLNDKDENFLGILMKYQLEGRYPDYNPEIPDKSKASEYLNNTSNLLQWLKEKL